MRYSLVVIGILLPLLASSSGCDFGEFPQPDPQLVKIQFQYGFRDMVDTFNGTLTKDLVLEGTVTIPFSLTKAEQEALLSELDQADFFNFPDTLLPMPGVALDPDPSPDMLHMEVNGKEKKNR